TKRALAPSVASMIGKPFSGPSTATILVWLSAVMPWRATPGALMRPARPGARRGGRVCEERLPAVPPDCAPAPEGGPGASWRAQGGGGPGAVGAGGGDGDFPAVGARRGAAEGDVAARRRQGPTQAVLVQDRQHLVRRVALGDAAQVQLHPRLEQLHRPLLLV